MRKWLKPLIEELEREHQTAQEHLRAADQQHTDAVAKYKAALSLFNELDELLHGLRDFAVGSQDGDE